jgi:hypothetical protein
MGAGEGLPYQLIYAANIVLFFFKVLVKFMACCPGSKEPIFKKL